MNNNNLTAIEKSTLQSINMVYGDTSVQSIKKSISNAIDYDGNLLDILVMEEIALKLYGVEVDYSKPNFGMF